MIFVSPGETLKWCLPLKQRTQYTQNPETSGLFNNAWHIPPTFLTPYLVSSWWDLTLVPSSFQYFSTTGFVLFLLEWQWKECKPQVPRQTEQLSSENEEPRFSAILTHLVELLGVLWRKIIMFWCQKYLFPPTDFGVEG